MNFETKPGSDGISFHRMKWQKAEFLDFLMKRRMEMIVKNRQNWPNIGPFFSYCRIAFPNNCGVQKFGRNLLKRIITCFYIMFSFFGQFRGYLLLKMRLYLLKFERCGHLLGAFKIKGCKLYNYTARNYFKISSKVYKFVPLLGVKNKKLQQN